MENATAIAYAAVYMIVIKYAIKTWWNARVTQKKNKL